ncbi:hypothetical protein AOXY_G2310 [Acipenser oxyrinchus oxyrinchus]|uniref:Uncharacterized protein n=1 Tax=Acipenser oxyrinchus oxyrinchus TaxID=40147 RepID=A0AAD8GIK8_ACIOX|nr:hypothetical protein AOXY_G2310 [Acipenser oxyrinchus oxyrinchus]
MRKWEKGRDRKLQKNLDSSEEELEELEEQMRQKKKKTVTNCALTSSKNILARYKNAQNNQEKSSHKEGGQDTEKDRRIQHLEEENVSLRHAVRMLKGLPESISTLEALLKEAEQWRKQGPQRDSSPSPSQGLSSLVRAVALSLLQPSNEEPDRARPSESLAFITQSLRDRCSKVSAVKYSCVVQWLKTQACNQEVPGSNPTSATDSLCDPEQVT